MILGAVIESMTLAMQGRSQTQPWCKGSGLLEGSCADARIEKHRPGVRGGGRGPEEEGDYKQTNNPSNGPGEG